MTEDQPAAIRATFADFRLIKGRKQAQLILEIPIEEADNAIAVLGGIPQPHSDKWVAVARLNPNGPIYEGMMKDDFHKKMQNAGKPEPELKEQRLWEDLRLSMQAGIRCEEKAFQRFLDGKYGGIKTNFAAADLVREICKIDSRSGLNVDSEAAERWKNLDRSYQAWLKLAE